MNLALQIVEIFVSISAVYIAIWAIMKRVEKKIHDPKGRSGIHEQLQDGFAEADRSIAELKAEVRNTKASIDSLKEWSRDMDYKIHSNAQGISKLEGRIDEHTHTKLSTTRSKKK